MSKINNIDKTNWRESELITDSLWLIPTRDKSGKHEGSYHGNFIPQVATQLMLRYTLEGDTVYDPFIGSGTTAYEAERLGRNLIGYDINQELISKLMDKVSPNSSFIEIHTQDSSDPSAVKLTQSLLQTHQKSAVQFAILHPPYYDIIKFSSDSRDLSNSPDIPTFLKRFKQVVANTLEVLEPGRYFAVVIGDKYSQKQWVPLGFYCMQAAIEPGVTLKSIVVKDIQGNRGKKNQHTIWRYRALMSDYYIFKHEYILIFKKELK